MKKNLSRTLTAALAGAGVLAAAVIGAAPASASGGDKGATSTVCLTQTGAGTPVSVKETPVNGTTVTTNAVTDSQGCVYVASKGTAATTVVVTAAGVSATARYTPTVVFDPAVGIVWADASSTTDPRLDAPVRTIQHSDAQAGRVGWGLTLTR